MRPLHKGFTSEILRFPNEHVTVIVLANLEDAHIVGPDLYVRDSVVCTMAAQRAARDPS